MNDRHPCDRSVSSLTTFNQPLKTRVKPLVAVAAACLATLVCSAQDQPQSDEQTNQPPSQSQPEPGNTTVTIPAGTNIALVLTHPIQTRYVHRGDDIYAQISAPVTSGNEVVIPPGTFVQGEVDKLERNRGRGEVRLQSMTITFPDGYVVPIPGPVTLVSDDGWALKDPGHGRFIGAFALPAAGAGIGALIGNAIADKQPGTLTASIPNGCTGPPPGCISSSTSVPAHPGMTIAEGAGIGIAVGAIASLVVLSSTHNYYLDAGTPVEMVLQRPVTLQQGEAEDAVQQAEQHPTPVQPVAARPVPPPPAPPSADHGTCWTPGTPGTPPTVIPGPPGPDGVPGPPTVIPGTPPTPGTPYPCP